MTTLLESLVARLRRAPESLAAAAALNDPGLLLHLEAERLRRLHDGLSDDEVCIGDRLPGESAGSTPA